tara:strand:- start:57 stop:620 length:564 start_codon:yes stop_codon:yes gene_type:complete
MKLNRKTLRRLIKEELGRIAESQKMVGLPHQYDYEELYRHAMRFLSENPIIDINADPDLYEKADLLLRILHNAVIGSVKHREGYLASGTYDYTPGTTDEEFEYMKDVQGKLKMARRALADTMGLKHRYRGGGGGREAISDKMRSLAQSGQLQRGQQPSDVPELRKNMPAYQPGGRFYDPDDIIHKMK